MPYVAYQNLNVPLITAIADWSGSNENAFKLTRLYSLKGGWEGWAQAELCMAIPDGFGLGGSCTREDRIVYTNGDRADLFHENTLHPNPANHTKNVIELKCQSLYQDMDGIGKFATAYKIDVGRIQNANRRTPYNTQDTKWWVVGIAPGGTGDGSAVANAITAFSDVNWAYHNQTWWTQRDQNSPMIFWTTYP